VAYFFLLTFSHYLQPVTSLNIAQPPPPSKYQPPINQYGKKLSGSKGAVTEPPSPASNVLTGGSATTHNGKKIPLRGGGGRRNAPSKYAAVDYSSQVFPSHRTWFSFHFPMVDVYQSVFGILKIPQQTEFSQAQTVNECEEIDSKASEQTLKLLLKWICVPRVRHEKLTTKLGKKKDKYEITYW
jgi:hypothetical protein